MRITRTTRKRRGRCRESRGTRDNTVKRVPVRGGGPVTLCSAVNPVDLVWDSSGTIFVDSQSSAFGAPAYQSDLDGDVAIFAQRADGSGTVKRLTTPVKGDAHIPESWSADGKHLSFAVVNGSGYALWTVTFADGKVASFHDVRSTDPIGSVFSPDSRWLAYYMNPGVAAQSSRGVWVRRFPSGEAYMVPKVVLDFQPVWSPRSFDLYFIASANSGQLAMTRMSTDAGVTFTRPQTFPARVNGRRVGSQARVYDILPDGKFVGLISASDETSVTDAAPSIQVVVNWFEELKARVPTR